MILDNIIVHSCDSKDYDTLSQALGALFRILLELQKKDSGIEKNRWDSISEQTAERIMRVIENNVKDNVITKEVIRGLSALGMKGVEIGLYDAISISTAFFDNYGKH